MVSGFLISPKDQLRMRSGLAMPIWIWSKVSGFATGLAKLVSSFMVRTFLENSGPSPFREEGRTQPDGTWEGEGALFSVIARSAPSSGFRLLRGFGQAVAVGVLDRGQFDVEAERPHFLDEHVEALGDAGLEGVVALDDRLIDPWCVRRRRPTSPSASPAACRRRRRPGAPRPPISPKRWPPNCALPPAAAG